MREGYHWGLERFLFVLPGARARLFVCVRARVCYV